jgi:antirestriction protein ArdC
MRASCPEKTDWSAILADAVNKPGVISKAYSTFWNYSVGNQISALFQCLLRGIEPGPIHTYKGWVELGRQVKKGEKAIVLTMPVTVNRKRKDAGPTETTPEVEKSDADSAVTKPKRTIFVERPHWFVLAQTDGKDYVPMAIPEWEEERALKALLIGRVPFRHMDGNAQGYATLRQVAISPIAFMPHRTLLHEVAHVVLGHTTETATMSDGDERTPRDVREVEAECVALICCESLGLPGAEFSRGYIQHWLKAQPIPEKSVHRIFKAADVILRGGRPEPNGGTPAAETDIPSFGFNISTPFT